MQSLLLWLFILLGGSALVLALAAFWQSVRAILGVLEVPAGSHVGPSESRRSLLEEKQTLLRSLKDIEFEREIGKISDSDFERLDRSLRARARDVLKMLDEDVQPFRAEAERLVKERLASEMETPYRSGAAPSDEAPGERRGEGEAKSSSEESESTSSGIPADGEDESEPSGEPSESGDEEAKKEAP